MMRTRPIAAALAAALLTAPPLAGAAGCFEPSPTTRATGDPYAAIEPTRLSSGKRATIEKLFAKLRGRWTGSADGFFCEGEPGDAKERADDGEVELEVDSTRDSLSMRADVASRERGSSRLETTNLYLAGEALRLDRNNAAGDSVVVSSSSSRLEILHKAVVADRGGGKGPIEISRRFRLSGSSLTIEFDVYSSTGLASHSTWKLKKR